MKYILACLQIIALLLLMNDNFALIILAVFSSEAYRTVEKTTFY